MVFVVGIAAALCLGVGYVVQQHVAARAQLSELQSWHLLWWLMHHRLWWAGVAAMVVGQLLGAVALNLASVGLVEPLLSTNLLFALALASYLSGQRVRWQEVSGALLLSAALGVFIAVGHPRGTNAPSAHPALVALAAGVLLGVVTALVVIGNRCGLVARSALLATAAGLLYGLQDVATRGAFVDLDRHGFIGFALRPWPYLVVGAATVGILLSQSAFRAARLDYSLPPITAAEPIAGIALGVALLGDTMTWTVGGLAVIAACLAAMLVAVALIGRSPSLAGQQTLTALDRRARLARLASTPAAFLRATRASAPRPSWPVARHRLERLLLWPTRLLLWPVRLLWPSSLGRRRRPWASRLPGSAWRSLPRPPRPSSGSAGRTGPGRPNR